LNLRPDFSKIGNLFVVLYIPEDKHTPNVYPLQLKDDVEYEVVRCAKIFRFPLIKGYDSNQDKLRINRWG